MALIDDCVAYYELGDAAGDALDSTASGYDGTVDGAVNRAVEGKIGDAIEIDSGNSNEYAVYFGATTFTGTSWTISFWLYQTSAAGGGYDQYIWQSNDGAGNRIIIDQNGDATGANMSLNIYDGGFDDTGLTVPRNQWTHIVVVAKAGTSKWWAFVDGSKSSELAYTAKILKTAAGNANGLGQMILRGKIDEVGIWNRDLTDAEVASLYNAGAGLAYPFVTGPDFTKLQVNIADAWKLAAGMQINIGDSWKQVAGLQINVADTWKTIF